MYDHGHEGLLFDKLNVTLRNNLFGLWEVIIAYKFINENYEQQDKFLLDKCHQSGLYDHGHGGWLLDRNWVWPWEATCFVYGWS